MVAPVRASAISDSGDLKVCGLPLVQTTVIRAPWTRVLTPFAMVSTSGSSGMICTTWDQEKCQEQFLLGALPQVLPCGIVAHALRRQGLAAR